PAEQSGALQRDQAVLGGGADLRQRRLDPRARVHRSQDHRQILGQAEQPVGLEHLVAAEALGAARQDAGGQAVALADRQQSVAEERAAGPVALREVRGELEAVLVHSAAPTACPRATAPKPTTSDPNRFSIATRS